MLDINVDININKGPTYPVYFTKNICVNCGAENSLVMVDIFGRECNQEIHPFDYIKCKKCNQKFSIEWIKNQETGKMRAVAGDKSVVQDFFNAVKTAKLKREGADNNI